MDEQTREFADIDLDDLGHVAEEFQQYLVFSASEGYYGLAVLDTHEILKPVVITRVPNVPPEILGVMNLRGNIIPVMDLNRKFGSKFTDLTNHCRIMVVAHGGKFLGLLADRVIEVVNIPAGSVEAREIKGLSHKYVRGVGRSNDQLFLIVNLEKLFGAQAGEIAGANV